MFEPVNGFFHISERLFGIVMGHLPLQHAPLVFALTAWLLFILLVYYLLSPRTKILSNNYERIFTVLALGLIANLDEFFFNFSNSAFLIGVIGVLIMVARKPRNIATAIAEKTFFLLACFTLPFAWFYLPVALIERFKYKSKSLFFLYVPLVAAIVQFVCFITSHVNRSPVTLLSLFSKYTLLEIYNQMIIPAVRFARIDVPVLDFTIHRYAVYTVFLTVATLSLAAFVVLRKSNKQVRYLLFFLIAMTFASIKSPTINVKTPLDAIKTMAVVVGANRYFVYGILAVNIIFIKAAYGALVPRARYAFMVFFIGFGLLTSMHYKAFYIDKHFTDYRAQYHHAIDQFESGAASTVDIPVNPTPWHMTLLKK